MVPGTTCADPRANPWPERFLAPGRRVLCSVVGVSRLFWWEGGCDGGMTRKGAGGPWACLCLDLSPAVALL